MKTWRIPIWCLILQAGVAGTPLSVALADAPAGLAGKLVRHYLARTPATVPSPPLAMAEAQEVQTEFVAALQKSQGEKIGYKAALTHPAAQRRFGVRQPLSGILLAGMLKKTGSRISTRSGIRLMFEADLLVRVGDSRINQARTHAEALASLSEVIPFVEVPDLVYGAGQKPDAGALTAINAGARYGVMGEPIRLQPTPEWIKRLAGFEVRIRGAGGDLLAQGKGRDLLGHPLEVVLWLRDQLHRRGLRLRPGELLSLGSLTRLVPARPGTRIRASYEGLAPAGPATVEVVFE